MKVSLFTYLLQIREKKYDFHNYLHSCTTVVYLTEFVCKLGFFGMSGPTSAKKGQLTTRTS
jgi:hypothetical protein